MWDGKLHFRFSSGSTCNIDDSGGWLIGSPSPSCGVRNNTSLKHIHNKFNFLSPNRLNDDRAGLSASYSPFVGRSSSTPSDVFHRLFFAGFSVVKPTAVHCAKSNRALIRTKESRLLNCQSFKRYTIHSFERIVSYLGFIGMWNMIMAVYYKIK